MQSVVGWKIAMAGLQKRLRFSLEYQTFSLKSQHLLAVTSLLVYETPHFPFILRAGSNCGLFIYHSMVLFLANVHFLIMTTIFSIVCAKALSTA